jgi:phospholipid/cholesterol/gamma-HCH transport system ATP-binding protein
MNPRSNEIPAIEFRHVSLSFDGKEALRDISFTLRHGEMICITGASASGKSVLLRLAIGLLRPDDGQIFIEGREIENLDESELLVVRGGLMGMVFQDEALFTGLSVYDNAAYRLVERGWSEREAARAVEEVLRFVGLQDDADKFPEELSGGMRRRLEIARALVGYPAIMLYDEPTSGLDPLTATQILNLIILARDIHHISSLVVTKRLDQIPYLASYCAVADEQGKVAIRKAAEGECKTKVMLLEKGRVAFIGTADEFAESHLPAVTYLTHAENGTRFSDSYVADAKQPRK